MDPYNNQPYNNQPNNFAGMPNSNGPSFPYTNRAINETKSYYDPYTEYARNPEDFLARISQSFKQNPGQIRANDIRMKEHTGAAAASGRINNPQYEEEHGDLASSLYNQDMQQYIDNIMKQQGLGLQAAQGASGDIGNLYNTAGTAAHQKDTQDRTDKNALISAILQAIGTMGGAYLGGPPGAAAGNAAGKGLSNMFSPKDNYNGGNFSNYLNGNRSSPWGDF